MLRSDIPSSAHIALVPANPLPLPIVPPELALKCCTMRVTVPGPTADVHGAKLGWSKSRSVIAKAKLTTSHIIDCCHILFPRVRFRHEPISRLLAAALTTVICGVVVLKHVGRTWR